MLVLTPQRLELTQIRFACGSALSSLAITAHTVTVRPVTGQEKHPKRNFRVGDDQGATRGASNRNAEYGRFYG